MKDLSKETFYHRDLRQSGYIEETFPDPDPEDEDSEESVEEEQEEEEVYIHPGYPIDREGNSSPYWQENILGSLSEERFANQPKNFKSYNYKVRKTRKEFQNCFSLENLLTSEDEYVIKLSDLEARHPSLTFERKINIQELTQSNMKMLRSFLWYFYTLPNVSNWIRWEIEESLDRCLPIEKLQTGGRTFRECYIIRQTFLLLGSEEGEKLLSTMYSEENIRRWKVLGRKLCINHQTVKIPLVDLREKVRRRGYRESSSNKLKTHSFGKKKKGDPVTVKNSPESIELEQIRERILLKQAKLFEQRLDKYLQISDPNITSQEKKKIFTSLVEQPETQYQFEESQISEKTEEN